MEIRKIADGGFSLEQLDVTEKTCEILHQAGCTWQEIVTAIRNRTLAKTYIIAKWGDEGVAPALSQIYTAIGPKREKEITAAVDAAGFILHEPEYSRGVRRLWLSSLASRNWMFETDKYETQEAFTEEQAQALYDYLKSELTQRETTVLEMRCGLNGQEPVTLRACAEKLHVSPERARSIEAKAIRKLRVPGRARQMYKILGLALPKYLQVEPKPEPKLDGTDIRELSLSTRCVNSLLWSSDHVDTIEKLVTRTEDDLMGYRGFGYNCLKEVKRELAKLGLRLKDA